MEVSKTKVKIAIFSFAILMMGVMVISSGLSEIGKHFSEVSQTSIQLLITLPCIVIIIVNPIIGKLQEYISMKTLVLIGILCFLFGGIIPTFLESFALILVFRAILGIGIGSVQVLSSALVAVNFEGDERSKVLGQLSSAQMIGCAVMVFVSGYLSMLGWNITFLVHLISVISLVCVAAFLPKPKPMKAEAAAAGAEKPKLTKAAFGWALTLLIFFIAGMGLATYLSFFIASQGLGSPAMAGTATMIFAMGGFLMGLVYGKVAQAAKNASLAVGLFMGVAGYFIVAFASNMAMVYIGSLIYGAAVTTVFASVMVGTSVSVQPIAVPLAMSIVTMGQNLGSFLCPYVLTPAAGLFGSDVNKYAFVSGAILFIVMGVIALIWGIVKNTKTSVPAAQN